METAARKAYILAAGYQSAALGAYDYAFGLNAVNEVESGGPLPSLASRLDTGELEKRLRLAEIRAFQAGDGDGGDDDGSAGGGGTDPDTGEPVAVRPPRQSLGDFLVDSGEASNIEIQQIQQYGSRNRYGTGGQQAINFGQDISQLTPDQIRELILDVADASERGVAEGC